MIRQNAAWGQVPACGKRFKMAARTASLPKRCMSNLPRKRRAWVTLLQRFLVSQDEDTAIYRVSLACTQRHNTVLLIRFKTKTMQQSKSTASM